MADTAAFGARYAQALADATTWHQQQRRKGTSIPYVSHLLAVSALVMEDGGTEDECIAGLLHDSIEDTPVTAAQLTERYGSRVAGIVDACTDDAGGSPQHKAPWWSRKVAHIAHVSAIDDLGVARVTAADKLSNLLSTLDAGDHAVFSRFKAGLGGFAWYHQVFGRMLVDRLGPDSLLGNRLTLALARLDTLVSDTRTQLGDVLVDVEYRLSPLAAPPMSAEHTPWPWFALDVVQSSGGMPDRAESIERWASWFDEPLPQDQQARSALMDVLSGRADVRQVLRALS